MTEEDDDQQERVTFRMPKWKVEKLDSLVEEGVYPNRSEALRDGADTVLSHHGKFTPVPDRLPQSVAPGGASD